MGKYNIEQYHPCREALEWYNKQPNFQTAWETCYRGDWMLWFATKIGVNDRLITLAKGYCANTVRHLMQDESSKRVVDMAIKYGKGEISRDELTSFIVAAAYAAYAADAYAAAYAAAAAYDAAAAYAADAKKENQRQTANICKKYLTKVIFEKIPSAQG